MFHVILLLALAGCTPKPITQTPTVNDTVANTQTLEMTKLANRLGITADNYPRIDGSTSTLTIVQSIYRSLIASADSDMLPYPKEASKTVPSYKKLIDGEVDLIFVPYASDDMLDQAREAGVEFEFHRIAAEALVFVTPIENTTENITREQVRSIYLDNKIKNWSVIGGPDKKLVPLCRNADSGSQSQMDNLVLDNKSMHPSIKKNYVQLTMEGMLDLVAFYHMGGFTLKRSNSYALGYTLYTYLQNITEMTGIGDRLKMLSFEGVAPSLDSIKDNSYPLVDAYYAVIRSDTPDDHSARIVLTWLQSDEGERLRKALGLIN